MNAVSSTSAPDPRLPVLRRRAPVAVRITAPAVPVARLGPVARVGIAATVVAVPFAGLVSTLIGQAL